MSLAFVLGIALLIVLMVGLYQIEDAIREQTQRYNFWSESFLDEQRYMLALHRKMYQARS